MSKNHMVKYASGNGLGTNNIQRPLRQVSNIESYYYFKS